MDKKRIIFLLTLVFGFVLYSASSTYAQIDKYYMVDTTMFHQLTQRERNLLDDYLPQIHRSKSDTQKVQLLNKMYEKFNDNDVWIKYLEFLKSIIDKPAFKENFPRKYNKYNTTYFNDKGYYLNLKGNHVEALESYYKVLKLDNKGVGDKSVLAYTHNNIAGIFFSLDDYASSNRHHYSALEKFENLKDTHGLALSYANLGTNYNWLHDYDSAQIMLNKAVALMRKKNFEAELSTTLLNLSDSYKHLNRKDSVIILSLEALKIAVRLGDNQLLNEAGITNSRNYYESGNLDSALNYAQMSFDNALVLNYPLSIQDAAKEVYRIKKDLNEFENALKYYEIHVQIMDSMRSESFAKKIFRKDVEYEYGKQKALDDKENEQRVALEKQKQKQQFIVLMIVIVAAALVLILLIIIYRRLKITRQQKLTIQERNEEVESQRDQIEEQRDLLEERHTEIQESIEYAKRIQTAILPPESLVKEYFSNSFVFYKPKDVVAGDFYWMEVIEDTVFLAIADCTGHGVPGAMVSVVCHGALNRSVREYGYSKPSEILNKTRELVIETFRKSEEQVKDGMDVSLLSWNRKTNKMQWSGANNPLYILRKGSNEIEIVKGDKEPIGYVQSPTSFSNHELAMNSGDMLYLFTDGFADQFGGLKGKKMGYKTFRNGLVKNSKKATKDQQRELTELFEQWKGDEAQVDDVCMMGIRI